jgi:hypothetical protein
MSALPPEAQRLLERAQALARGRPRRLVLEGESVADQEYRVAAERLLQRGLEADELAALLLEAFPPA